MGLPVLLGMCSILRQEKDTGIVYGDLYEDLGSIYKYTKTSLLLYGMKSSDAKQNAVWDFKWNFDAHWSGHCANAICAIHYFSSEEPVVSLFCCNTRLLCCATAGKSEHLYCFAC